MNSEELEKKYKDSDEADRVAYAKAFEMVKARVLERGYFNYPEEQLLADLSSRATKCSEHFDCGQDGNCKKHQYANGFLDGLNFTFEMNKKKDEAEVTE